MSSDRAFEPVPDHPRITFELPPVRPVERQEEKAEVRRGLLASPPEISPKYFYDDHGSALFEQICELPEYYQTRTERRLLEQLAPGLCERTGAQELVELGAGAATKTRVLLDAMARCGKLRRYVPLDVSDGILRRAAEELVEEYPELVVHGVVGDFLHHLDHLPEGGPRLVIFLGGTIGNLEPESEAVDFLASVAAEMESCDAFLLGADLIKETARLEAAYNDSAGVTAEFNRNTLRVLNRRFRADFDPAAFEHHAFYNREQHRIEMWLRASRPQRVRINDLELELSLAAGEEIRTEISTKFDRPLIEELLASGGFELVEWHTDPDELFSVSLARKR